MSCSKDPGVQTIHFCLYHIHPLYCLLVTSTLPTTSVGVLKSAMSTQFPFGDPKERREWLPHYAISFEVVTTFFVALRFVSRFQKAGGKPGIDDVFILFAWVRHCHFTCIEMNDTNFPRYFLPFSLRCSYWVIHETPDFSARS